MIFARRGAREKKRSEGWQPKSKSIKRKSWDISSAHLPRPPLEASKTWNFNVTINKEILGNILFNFVTTRRPPRNVSTRAEPRSLLFARQLLSSGSELLMAELIILITALYYAFPFGLWQRVIDFDFRKMSPGTPFSPAPRRYYTAILLSVNWIRFLRDQMFQCRTDLFQPSILAN